MSIPTYIAVAGLVLDIVGVVLLFVTTSPRHIEAYISIRLVEAVTPREGDEWLHSYSFEEHTRSLAAAWRRVKQTQCWTRIALSLICAGFLMQLVALFLRQS